MRDIYRTIKSYSLYAISLHAAFRCNWTLIVTLIIEVWACVLHMTGRLGMSNTCGKLF